MVKPFGSKVDRRDSNQQSLLMNSWIFILLFSLCSILSWGQVSDREIADYHFNQGHYEEAILYYDRLYKSEPSEAIYQNYLKCLLGVKNYEDAEALIKKKIKGKQSEGLAYVQLGSLYLLQNKQEEAMKQFQTAIDKTDAARAFITRLAQEFINIQQFPFALQAYEKGQKKGKDGYLYQMEIASVKGSMGDMDGMFNAFLDLLSEEPHYLSVVETTIARLVKFEDQPIQADKLKSALLKRIQTQPDVTIHAELLIWFFLQNKNFAGAYQQCISLDKRQKENGNRLMDLAQICLDNDQYSIATQCYDYVVAKGMDSPFGFSAKIGSLNAQLKWLQTQNPSFNDLQKMAVSFETALTSLPQNDDTYILLENYAKLLAFQLHQASKAEKVLEEGLEWRSITPKTKAKIKLIMGDVLMIQNRIWEASLLYSQVELEFKEDILGNEARFKNAKVSFYAGDFGWCQSQLEALKASTSKLVANDAIELSVVITESIQDSIEIPLEMYARAELLALQNDDSSAFLTLDSLFKEYPGHPLLDDALFLKAKTELRKGRTENALKFLQEIIDFHFTEIKMDDALFLKGQIQETQLNNKEEAMATYEKLLTDHPGSLLVVEARRRYRILRGDNIQ
jgi:tetratricopeptide (TPR) repeat protein